MRLTKKILILFSLIIFAASANASGIKVNPPKLEIAAKLNESVTREITVTNPASDVQLFKAYPDDFADIVKANPSSFTLEAGAKKTVIITIEVKDDQKNSTNLSTNLSVTAKPLAETQFAANAGVKIPLSITISQNASSDQFPKQAYYAFALIALIIFGSLAYFLRRKPA